MSTLSFTNKPAHARGAALVELAIVTPLLLLVFCSVADVGRALLLQHLLVYQVEGGARFMGRTYQTLQSSCAQGTGWAAASTAAANLVVYNSEAGGSTPIIKGMTTSDVTISAFVNALSGTDKPCVIQVTASVPYTGLFGTKIPFLNVAEPTLNAASQERYIGE